MPNVTYNSVFALFVDVYLTKLLCFSLFVKQNEWVISRIFHKSSGGKKIHISGLTRNENFVDELQSQNLPQLLDISRTETSHVPCFSEELEEKKFESQMLSPLSNSPNIQFSTSFISSQMPFQYPESFFMQDSSLLKFLVENNETEDETRRKQSYKTEFSQDTGGISTDISSVVSNHDMGQSTYEDQEYPITSAGPVDLDCLWNY